jgi:hypothetical protein
MLTVAETSNPSEGLSARFSEFVVDLTLRLGVSATVSRQSLTPIVNKTSIEPANPFACPVSIIEMGDQEWILGISRGARWELVQSLENLALVESLVSAVVEGRVFETIRPGGARVLVTTSDGKIHKSGAQGSRMVFFADRKHWYRKREFAPYRQPETTGSVSVS